MMNSVDQYPRRKRSSLMRIVAIAIIGLMTLACLGWLWIPIRGYIEYRHEQRLANLAYPAPSDQIDESLVYTEHLHGINITTQWRSISTDSSQQTDPHDRVLLQARTRITPPARERVDTKVMIQFSATGATRLPANEWNSTTLVLTSKADTICLKTNSYLMGLAGLGGPEYLADNPDDRLHDEMLFKIPTEFFIQAINENDLSIQLGQHTYQLDPETLAILRDFAATLKPGYPSPKPDHS